MYDDDNVFAQILRGDIRVDAVYSSLYFYAFKDHKPLAPVHVICIPRRSYVSFQDFSTKALPEEMEDFFSSISSIVDQFGLADTGYRLITNVGNNGGQEVPHFHVHILGGRPLGSLLV